MSTDQTELLRPDPPPDPPARPPTGAGRDGRRSRGRRLLRRIGVSGLVVLGVLTSFSLVYNQVTVARVGAPAGLRYLRTDDLRTRIRSWGDAGSPVVLVHGFAESADTWAAVGERLGARHRVYALDLDGWGYTQRVAPFDLDHQVRQLLALIDALHLVHPVLVGHSSGAAIAAEAALRSPASVGGLLMLDGDALATGAGQRTAATRLLLAPFRTTLLRSVAESDPVIRSVYQRQCGPRCPALDEAGIDVWRRPLQVPGAEAGLWEMINLGVPGIGTDRLAGLARLPFPKSVVFGAQDTSYPDGTPQQTATRIGAPAPELLPDARHLTMISDPGPVAAAVQALLDRAR